MKTRTQLNHLRLIGYLPVKKPVKLVQVVRYYDYTYKDYAFDIVDFDTGKILNNVLTMQEVDQLVKDNNYEVK